MGGETRRTTECSSNCFQTPGDAGIMEGFSFLCTAETILSGNNILVMEFKNIIMYWDFFPSYKIEYIVHA